MQEQTVAAYSFFPRMQRWLDSNSLLGYTYLSNVPSAAIPAIDRAFQSYATATHFSFQRVEAGGDITIEFASGSHGDGYPFDGPGGVLAHAFTPTDGKMHHDASEPWSSGPGTTSGFDIETVAAHEIGHLLGLGHSSFQGALMYASISQGERKGLHEDDFQGIRALYSR